MVRVGNLDSARDFLDVRDAVRAYVEVAAHGEAGEVYNVGSGEAVRVQSILELLIEQSSASVEVVHDEVRKSPWDVPVQRAEIARIAGAIGWTPRLDLRRTLADLLDSWRARVGSG